MGDHDDALALHHALVAVGRLSPLAPDQVIGEPPQEPLNPAEAVARARMSLVRRVAHVPQPPAP
jgi:hypothetical protein